MIINFEVDKMKSLLVFFLIFFQPVLTQETSLPEVPQKASLLEAWVPKNWKLITFAEGDLNGDKVSDKAIVIQKQAKKNTHRKLIILFQEKNFLTLAGISSQVILSPSSGGKSGDPFSGISIRGGILFVEHQGGTNLLWKYVHKYQFRKNGFYLIGKINQEIDVHSKRTLEVHTNLLTGEVIRKETSPKGIPLPVKVYKIKKEELHKLQ